MTIKLCEITLDFSLHNLQIKHFVSPQDPSLPTSTLMVEHLSLITFSGSCSEVIKIYKQGKLEKGSFYFPIELHTTQGSVFEILSGSYEEMKVIFKSFKTLIESKHNLSRIASYIDVQQ